MNTLLGFLLIISILFSPLKVSSYFRTRHSRKKKEPLVDPSPQKSILSTSAHAPKILCQRSYDTKKGDSFRISLVIGLGFEPRTHSLEGCCSIQLSYLTILICGAKVALIFIFANRKVFFFIRRDILLQNARQNYSLNWDSE